MQKVTRRRRRGIIGQTILSNNVPIVVQGHYLTKRPLKRPTMVAIRNSGPYQLQLPIRNNVMIARIMPGRRKFWIAGYGLRNM